MNRTPLISALLYSGAEQGQGADREDQAPGERSGEAAGDRGAGAVLYTLGYPKLGWLGGEPEGAAGGSGGGARN